MSGLQPPDGTKEIIEGVTEAIKQRVGSPLLFGFLVSWCFLNYRFLLVIFADDPYKVKFTYISQNLEVSFFLPIVYGLLIAVLLPLSEIPYRPFRAFCRNVERRAVLWVEKRRPMDVYEQATAFSEKDIQLNELKERVISSNAAVINLEGRHNQEIISFSSKMTATCLLYLAVGSDLNSDQVKAILLGSDNDQGSRAKLINVLSKHPMTVNILAFVSYVKMIRGDGENREVSIQDLQHQMTFDPQIFQQFLDVLVAIGFLRTPSNYSRGFWNSPLESPTFKRTLQIFIDARS